MSGHPEPKYPALAQAREQLSRLSRARQKLESAWTPLRRIATAVSILIPGSLLAVLGTQLVSGGHETGESIAIFYLILLGTPCLVNWGLRLLQARQQHMSAVEVARFDVYRRCTELEPLPEPVADPLNRALDSYTAVFRIADDPVWREAKLSQREFLQRATERMRELCEWARRLKLIDARLRQLTPESAAHPEHRETLTHYRLQCEQLQRAADVFTQAEAKMTRAYAAMSGEQSRTLAANELRNLTATFDALTEIVTPLEWHPSSSAEAAPAPLRAGLGE